jgi:hypothetical protein
VQDVVVMGVGVRVSTAGCVAVGACGGDRCGRGCPSQCSISTVALQGDVVVMRIGVRVGMAGHVAVGDIVLSQRCQCNIRACESR